MNHIAIQSQANTIKNFILAHLFEDVFQLLTRFAHETDYFEKYEDELSILEVYYSDRKTNSDNPLENNYLTKNLLFTLKSLLHDITQTSGHQFTNLTTEFDNLIADYQKNIKFHPKEADVWFEAGEAWQKMDLIIPAIEAFERCTMIHSENRMAWNNLSVLYRKQDDFQKSIHACLKSIEIEPKDYLWISAGISYEILNQLDKAEEAFTFALDLNAKNEMAWNSLGRVCRKENKLQDAVKAYQKVVEIYPLKHKVWENLGSIYIDLETYEEAIKFYLKAIDIQSNNSISWFNLGYAYDELGRYDEAILSYQKSLNLDDDFETWCNLGISFTAQKKYSEAIESFNKSIALNSEDSETWMHLANAYFHAQNYAKSEKCCETALKLNPNYQWANHAKGSFLLMKGKLEEAEQQYLSFPDENTPNYITTLGHFALCKGAKKEAYKLYLKSLKMCKNEQIRTELITEMEDNYVLLKTYDIPENLYQKLIEDVQQAFILTESDKKS